MQQGGGPSGPPPEGVRLADHLRSAEPASPIRSWPPPPAANFDTPVGHGNPVADGVVEMGESSAATGGNRWPRQETLALLKIRSEMDTAFRDAPLKAPLWDEVARKLGELGYTRSGKKCKEKFENVHKYYKRTKEGRSGRQDGKSYRFFNQLEALHGSPGGVPIAASVAPAITLFATTAATVTTPVDELPGSILPANSSGPNPPSVATPQPVAPTVVTTPIAAPPLQPIAPPVTGISFSSSSSESKDESEEREGREGRKRKRGGSRRKMAAFFDGLMRQVTERQEAMQRHFLEMIEKREEERLVREEAWRQHATARLAREHELLVQERAAAASRDAAIIAFLQKLTGHNIQLPPISTIVEASAPAPPPSQLPPQPQSNQLPQTPVTHEMLRVQHQLPPSSSALRLAPANNTQEIGDGGGVVISEPLAPSSRWPKVEVHALIQLRSSLETKYQEAGPKGPLWEEISSEMGKLGYNRNPKRCKEKWENINKYFKKVKESNRKRPQDAKTCPYFHQLDALYRQKLVGHTGSSSASASHMTINQISHHQPQETSDHPLNPIIPNPIASSGAHATLPPPLQVHPAEGSDNDNRNSGNADCTGASGSGEMMKEGIAREMMAKLEKSKDAVDDYNDRLEEQESDHLDEDDDDDYDYDDEDDDDEEDKKMQYKVQLQRPDNASGSGGAAPATSSFLSMV